MTSTSALPTWASRGKVRRTVVARGIRGHRDRGPRHQRTMGSLHASFVQIAEYGRAKRGRELALQGVGAHAEFACKTLNAGGVLQIGLKFVAHLMQPMQDQ